jgi:hypothetical protein
MTLSNNVTRFKDNLTKSSVYPATFFLEYPPLLGLARVQNFLSKTVVKVNWVELDSRVLP